MEVSGKGTNLLSKPCEICQTRGADGFCTECTEYMCKECFDHHVKAKPCRHHALCSLDQGQIQIATKQFDKKCNIHRKKKLKYYCPGHEVVGCGDCMISNHDGCKPKFIRNMATNFEESGELKEMLRKIKVFDKESKENLKRVQNNLKENKNMLDKALGEISKFRKEINDYIDEAEKTVIAGVKKFSNENETLLSELQVKIAIVSEEVDDIRNKLDTNMHQGVDQFIRMIECKQRVSKVEQTFAEIKLTNTIKAYFFVPEKNFRDVLTSNVKLGYIYFKSKQQLEPNPIPHQRNTGMSRKTVGSEPLQTGLNLEQIIEIDNWKLEPRSAGFDVGARVRTEFNPWKGTVLVVDADGNLMVGWDDASLGFCSAEELTLI